MLTVHHLNFSRSTWVLWLREQIGRDYRLQTDIRTPGFAAPQSLRAVHPLGKAPVLDHDGILIIESTVILTYLSVLHSGGPLRPAAQRLVHDQWLHWAESSAAGPLMTLLYASFQGGLSGVCAAIIEREAGDVIVKEHWAQNGFANTDLDLLLKQHGVQKVILVGLVANSCIEATGRYAMEIGYHVTLVTDATAAFSPDGMLAAKINAPMYAHAILTTQELLALLSKESADA